MFYSKNTLTGERKSLRTKDREAAEPFIFHQNEAAANVQINRKIGMAYLSAADPELTKRTWKSVMEDILKDKHGPTLIRYERAMKDKAYRLILDEVLLDTQPEQFKAVLRAGSVCTNVYLRRYQNHAVDMGWLRRRIGAQTVQIKLRYGDFTTLTRQLSVEESITEAKDIYRLGCYILARDRLVSWPLRLIGLGVSSLGEAVSRQLVLPLK